MSAKTIHVQGDVTILAWLGDLPDTIRNHTNCIGASEPVQIRLDDIPEAVAAAGEALTNWEPCRKCQCTNLRACDPPCHWVEPDLCSACASDSDD